MAAVINPIQALVPESSSNIIGQVFLRKIIAIFFICVVLANNRGERRMVTWNRGSGEHFGAHLCHDKATTHHICPILLAQSWGGQFCMKYFVTRIAFSGVRLLNFQCNGSMSKTCRRFNLQLPGSIWAMITCRTSFSYSGRDPWRW